MLSYWAARMGPGAAGPTFNRTPWSPWQSGRSGNAQETARIGDLAATLGLSQDRLEKRFRRLVGTTPRQLATLLRLRRALASHRAGKNLSQVSIESGYFDQSHFIRDFRAVTGESPRRFFQATPYC